jgi:hypothetical protein
MQFTIIDKIDNKNDAWGRALWFIFCAAYGLFLASVIYLHFFCIPRINKVAHAYYPT